MSAGAGMAMVEPTSAAPASEQGEGVPREYHSGRGRRRISFSATLFYLLLGFWTIMSLGPLLWMLLNSLRTNTEIFTQPIGLPSWDNLDNYAEAWAQAELGQALINSIILAVGSMIVAGFCSYLIGFALSRGNLRFSNALMIFFLLGLMIPTFSLLLPLLLQFQDAGLVSTRHGLILVYSGFMISLGVFLFKNSFDAIPREYLEAAILDGASVPRILTTILLPMMMPTIATFAILTFLTAYNDYVFALVLNNDQALRPLPVALLQYSGTYGTQYDLVFAAVSIATLPPLIAYLFLRKQVQASLAVGGRTG